MKIYWLLFVVFAFSCSAPQDPAAISFYYWKTKFSLDSVETTALTRSKTEKLYIRYFDVGLQHDEAFPISAVIFEEIPKQAIVPVIYIKNEVVLSRHIAIDSLASRIYDYIQQINTHYGLSTNEIQVDCDWTIKSKENFFGLLKELRKCHRGNLSATIRLHQIKYFEKTGIPPVDYGVLMYYNMGTLAPDTINSIYDKNTAARYTYSLKRYPLPLNIALPIFSWAVHIRGAKVINLLNRIDENNLSDTSIFRRQQDGKYQVIHEGNYFGQLFAAGDRIKVESVSAEMLQGMGDDLRKHLKNKPTEIIFYDLDRTNIQHYEHDIFQKISTRFDQL